MTATITCDWCGEPIDTRYPDHPPHLTPDGLTNASRRVRSERLHYHAEPFDSESCMAQAIGMLRNRAEWANKGDDSGLEWRLLPAARRTVADGHTPIMEEFSQRVDAGTALHKLDLPQTATRGLREANIVTLEEVAGRSAEEIQAIDGVGAKSLRRLEEELERLGLTFGEEPA